MRTHYILIFRIREAIELASQHEDDPDWDIWDVKFPLETEAQK